MNVVDDALRPRGLASKPFDAEGLATRKMHFVADGILGSWVLDLYAARRLGLASTGHAARGTGSPPSASTTNLYLEPGSLSPEQMIREVGEGLFVPGMIGSGAEIGRAERGERGGQEVLIS